MELSSEFVCISETELFEYAAQYARLIMPDGKIRAKREAERLSEAVKAVCGSAKAADERMATSERKSTADEWLTDNLYMVRRQGKSASAALSAAPELRAYRTGAMLYELCAGLVRSGEGEISPKRLEIFLDGFQSVTVLTQREIALIPDMLTSAVIAGIESVSREENGSDDARRAKHFEALFTSLRLLAHVDLGEILERINGVNAVLESEHTGIYSRMDAQTKRRYLSAVEKKAAEEKTDEISLARELTEHSRQENIHIGFLLLDEKKKGAGWYIGLNVMFTLLLSLLAAFALESPLTGILLIIPVSELVKAAIDLALAYSVHPERLPGLDMSAGIPDEGRTVCVISSLLTDEAEADRACAKLERLRLASRSEGENLLFGILADLKESSVPAEPEDEGIISRASRGVEALNAKYGGGFYLFTREREFNGRKYSGRERKRGAMAELARLLCGQSSKLRTVGDLQRLRGAKYILTLDADTEIYPGSVGRLVGAMLHPLNTPVIDHRRKTVTAGHAVIQPRIATSLESAGRTDFAIIFSGGGGSDPYGSLCGEVYMDAFASGGFAGKGIIDAAALLECTGDRLDGRGVLSHDALEGAYLRGAYLGDAEFYDDFPGNTLSYYKRLHRWVRGDWQNLRWVFAGDIAPIERFRLFDSLRRSLLAPATLAAILCGLLFPSMSTLSAWTALIALTSEIAFALISLTGKPKARHRLRRCTRLLGGVGGAIVRCFMHLWFLPYEAWVCLSGACTALWRSFISHKGLLEWETQAQSDRRHGGIGSTVSKMKIPMLIGALSLVLSRLIIGRAAGIMWLLSPAAAWAMSLASYKPHVLSRTDRAYIASAAADTWRYFAELSRPEDNRLPPDNFQEQPPMGVSHTASPTNMGLSMASAVAACDMKIISVEEACEFISRIVLTLERMPRHMGHFYNWYDTRSLLPLHPAFISTVDSGNMYASMVVVSAFLEENGRYKLRDRLQLFMDEMDFRPLYDEKRGLFHICYNTAEERPVGGRYDLMASEAMLTGYIALAKGDVSVEHWRRLSRAQVQKDGYRGLVSWTGTMFEYLMSVIFLPIYRDSLIYESSRFCLYAQRKRVSGGIPWGISESAFFALDDRLRYRYKAHGCGALALKRGQDRELVVSPYSSFLALAVDAAAAVRNLRRLEGFGARGRYGFIEAVDFTPGRGNGERVQCYMVHHQAMSLLAAANALCGGSISRRFMRSSEMSAFNALLKERIPEDGGVISVEEEQFPEVSPRRHQWHKSGGAGDRGYCVLSNGAYTLTMDESGQRSALFGGMLVSSGRYGGLSFRLKTGRRSIGLLPRSHSMWEMSENLVSYSDDMQFGRIKTTVFTPEGTAGAVYELEIEANTDTDAELELAFRPILAPQKDFESQSAFLSLGISAEEKDGTLILRRISRDEGDDTYLALSCSEKAVYSADRKGTFGALTEPYVSCTVPLSLRKDGSYSVSFGICASYDSADALSEARRITAKERPREGSMISIVSTYLGMTEAQTGFVMELAERIDRGRIKNAPPKRELWKHGISGDFPVISCEAEAAEAEDMIKAFCALKSCGIDSELAFITFSSGEYRDPQRDKIEKTLRSIGLEALMWARGGVFTVGTDGADTVRRWSVYYPGYAPRNERPIPEPFAGMSISKPVMPEYRSENGAFVFNTLGGLPARPWQNILTNSHFGYIATERGSGHMFLENAREMRVDPSAPLPGSICGAEQIWAERAGERISLFAMPDGESCTVSFEPGVVSWKKKVFDRDVTLTAVIARNENLRIMLLEGADGLDIYWRMETVIGTEKGESVICHGENGIFSASNPESFLDSQVFRACTNRSARIRCDYDAPGMLMGFRADDRAVLICGFEENGVLSPYKDPARAEEEINAVRANWKKRLDGVKLRSPNKLLNDYVNQWAAYQTIAGRLEARGSIYQSGGAVGFRDQLQDSVNMLLLDRTLARAQILLCCEHQYLQGDVMHWWHPHPDGDRGIRTRCSDDLLWLVWALCEYAEKTGDTDICLEKRCYVNSMPLAETEKDRYEIPEKTEERETVLDHCVRAIECCEGRGFGEHGLPLMLSGDWNDSMNRFRGESVWLGWFFVYCTEHFSALCERLNRPSERFRELSERVRAACEASFNGRWYERGYSKDTDISAQGRRIDSICQSWSVFCHAKQGSIALEYAISRLYDSRTGLIKLLDPPYGADEPRPGYITGYGEGCRENGGQYTHGALWLAMACFISGRTDAGYELMCELISSPHAPGYGAEPFVLPADICTAPGHEGEAGWTWYTGSAGWFYRIATEYIMGIRMENGKIYKSKDVPLAVDRPTM